MNDLPTARDLYARYYTEKLWRLVPEVYKSEDTANVLREMIALIAEDAAEVRRSIDRLWEDQHVESCDDWAVPYIGALVGTRLVSAQDRRARRVDVANTIRFRRRRGTPDLLDTLARALSGWDVVLEEGFRQLARARHRLDGPPQRPGLFTRTPRGGTADLGRPVGAEIAEGPFGEFFHTLDSRRLRGRTGRYGVRKLNFHLYRIRAFEMTGVDPVELTDPGGAGFLRTFTFDPSGRSVPLFLSGEAEGPDDKTAITRGNPIAVEPRERDIVQPMRCRLLSHAVYEVTGPDIPALQDLPVPPLASDIAALAAVEGTLFEGESALRRRLRDMGAGIPATPPDWYVALLGRALVEDCGKAQLYPRSVRIGNGGDEVPAKRVSAANLANLFCHPTPPGNLAEVLVWPEDGYFASEPQDAAGFAPDVLRYYYGFPAELGAGPYPRPDLDPLPTRVASLASVEDAELAEVALGGLDTSLRVRRMAQVAVEEVDPDTDCEAAWAAIRAAIEAETGGAFTASGTRLDSSARLRIGLVPGEALDPCAPCSPDDSGRYLGADNQAIRIMMAAPDRYVFALDNAGPIYRVRTGAAADGLIPVTMLTEPADEARWPLVRRT